jgi:hypothetical protein
VTSHVMWDTMPDTLRHYCSDHSSEGNLRVPSMTLNYVRHGSVSLPQPAHPHDVARQAATPFGFLSCLAESALHGSVAS